MATDIGLQERDTFFQLSLDMLCIADLSGVFQQVNQAWERTLGHTAKELTSVPYLEFVHPDDREATEREMARLEDGEDVLDFRNRYRKKDGSYVWLSWRAHVQRQRGLIYAVARDVTERVRDQERLAESERRFRTLAESAPVPIWMTDEEGRWTYSNKKWRELTGWSPAESRSHDWSERIHADDRERCVGKYRTGIAAGHPFTCEARLLRADGELRWVLLTAWPRTGDEGRGMGFVGTIVDVTQRKREEEQRQREHAKHVEKLQSLSLLSSGVAHDFSSLLMTILGHVDVVKMQTPTDAPFRRSLEAIQEAASRASDLCRQLLTYAGKGDPEMRPVALGRVVQDILELLEVSIPRTTTLVAELAPDLPPVQGDPGQLGQVVLNLVRNAAEAIGSEGGAIRVRTGVVEIDPASLASEYVVDHQPAGGAYVLLEVEDDGPGMDTATLERVFDPFFTTKHSGRGFGLAVVLGIVRAHGGAIHVRTAPGKGTRLRVMLPPSPDRVVQEDGGKGGLRPMSVLVVDDEDSVLDTTRGMLEKLGWDVRTAHRGTEAVDLLRHAEHPVELAILDVELRGEPGSELGARLVAERPDLKVLFTDGERQARTTLRPHPPAHVLRKPFSTQQLLAAIEETLAAP